MHKNRTTLIFFLSILITLASLATLFLFWKIIENKNEHTSNVISTLADKMAKKENAAELTAKMAEIADTESELDSHFVDSRQIDSFLAYLEGLGTTAGAQVAVKSFDPSATTDKTLVINLTAVGSYTSVMRTLTLLENAPYRMHITKAYLNKGTQSVTTIDAKGVSKTTETPSWQADISFSVLISS
jgi:predicted O-linked N-acetylglucosamine transferase (SPINDLY family)